jgi:squalene cyclase
MNTRPTPETDAFAIKFINGVMSGRYWVPVDVARKLESELNEARGSGTGWRRHCKKYAPSAAKKSPILTAIAETAKCSIR